MTTALTIRELHALAYTRQLPREDVHGVLHDAAVMGFHVGGLCELDAQQRRLLAAWLRQQPERARPPRKRSGRRRPPGVIPMATPGQRRLINTIASELGWSASLLSRFLRTHYRIDTVEEITTSERAGDVIRHLKACKYDQKQRRRRKAASS